MSVEQNKAQVRRFYDDLNNFWRTGDTSFLDRTFDKNLKQHISGFPPNADNLQALKQMLPGFRTALPDLQMKVHDVIAEGDKVVARVSWEGKHEGEMMGIPASGKQLNVSEIHIYRFENGRIVERWGEWDMFGMMQQIGQVPQVPA